MTKGRRKYFLRYYDEAQNDLDRALSRLKILAENYADVHPQHTQFLETLSTMIIQIQEYLHEFRERYM